MKNFTLLNFTKKKMWVIPLMLLFFSVNSFAQTTVCSSGCDYTTIQAAIDAASNGDVIQVQDGTYAETIDVNKDGLTLQSQNGAASTFIEGSGAAAAGATVRITADNVTVDGFTIDNLGDEDGCVSGGNDAANTTVKNNTLTNSERGVRGDFYGTFGSGISIDNNVFDGVTRGVTNSENWGTCTVTNNEFNDIGANAVSFGTGITSVTFTGNTFSNVAFRTVANYESTSDFDVDNAFTSNTYDRAVKSPDVDNAIEQAIYSSFQLAVIEAVSGSTLDAQDGTYEISATIEVDKPLTITGESMAGVILDASGITTLSERVIETDADDVTLENFTIKPVTDPDPMANNNIGFTIKAGSNSAPNIDNNLTLKNITIDGAAERTPFDVHGIDGVTIENLNASGTTRGNGINITGCTAVNIDGFTGTSNAWGSIAVYASRFVPASGRGSDDVTIVGSSLDIDGAVFSQDDSVDGMGDPLADPLYNTNISVTGWDYNVFNADFRSQNDGPEYTYFDETETDATATAESLNMGNGGNTASAIQQISTGDWFVTNDNLSIQAAIDEAETNDLIEVYEGTYAERIFVYKQVDLRGPNYGISPNSGTRNPEAIIVPPENLIDEDEAKPEQTAPYLVVFYNDADGIEMDGFTINGDNPNIDGFDYAGMNIEATLGVLSSGLDDIVFTNNIVENFTYMGFLAGNGFDDESENLTLSDNKFNNIHDLNALGFGFATYIQATSGTISNNVLTNTRNGIQVQPYSATGTGSVTNNNYDVYGSGIWYNYARSGSGAWTIEDNSILGINPPSSITGGSGVNWSGIMVQTMQSGGGSATFQGNTVDGGAASTTSADFEAVIGYRVRTPNGNATDINTFTNNSVDNVETLINNQTTETVNTTCNWWGTTDPAAIEDGIVGSASWSPFLVSDDLDNPDCSGVAPVTNVTQGLVYGTIQAAIDDANAADEITAEAGTYEENLLVDKHVEIVGEVDGSGNPTTLLRSATDDPLIRISGSGADASNPILIENFDILTDNTGSDQGSRTGIDLGPTSGTGSVSFVKLDNVVVTGNNHAYPGLEYGLSVFGDDQIDELEVVNSSFSDLSYGLFAGAISSGTPGAFDNVTITNTTFDNNSSKGIYVEMLNSATFTDLTVTDNGSDQSLVASWAAPWGSGIDINLKYNDYAGIIMSNVTATGNGLDARDGAAIAIKARDDGATYSVNPATLDNVFILNSSITDNERGVRFGEPGKNNATPTNITISSSTIEENRKTYTNTDGGDYGDVINELSVDFSYAGDDISAGQAVWNVVTTESLDAVLAETGETDLVKVESGTYAEAVSIATNGVELRGLGAGVTLNGGGSDGINLTADDVTIDNFTVTGFNDGLELGSTDGVTLVDCAFDDNNINNLKVSNAAVVTNLTVTDCSFDDAQFGWYISNSTSGGTNTFDEITVSETSFSGNTKKGIYAEKMSNADFDDITVDGSGVDATYNFNNGIDINLKWADYSNITITNSSIINSGVAGPGSDPESPAAICIKARDDSPSYDSPAATLDNVTFTGNVVSGPENGLRFGEFGKTNNGPSNAVVNNNDFSHAFANDALTYNVENEPLDAGCNWWGSATGPEGDDITEGGSGVVYADPFLTTSDLDDPTCEGVDCASITPSNLGASDITNTSSVISWSGVPNVLFYQIWTPVTGVVNLGASTSYNLTGLTEGTTYDWSVRAVCTGGGSSAWAEDEFTTAGTICADVTAADFNMSESGITNTSATLNWDAISGVLFYQIWTPVTGVVNVGTSTSYNLTGLTEGTTYDWSVRAVCTGGGSSAWAEDEFTTTGTTCADVTAADFNMSESGITNTSATLNWDAISGVLFYQIWTPVTGVVNVGTSTSYNLTGLTEGTTYDWSVRAVCTGGGSSAWAEDEFTTTGTICADVTAADFNMSESGITSTSATLNWDAHIRCPVLSDMDTRNWGGECRDLYEL